MTQEFTLAAMASEVENARDALERAARTDADRWWTIQALVEEAHEDSRRPTMVMIALDQLLDADVLQTNPDWLVRLVK